MKINFLLPFAGNKPIGGFKIIYEYANRLVEKGHIVNLIHPSFTLKDSPFKNFQYLIRYYQRKIDKSYLPDWFNLDPRINVLWIRKISNENVPDADALIASAWRTAVCAEKLSLSKGKKFYFIQHYEIWNGPEKEVNRTWKLPFVKIVIAKWLKDIADSFNEKSYYVPNAFEFSEFGMDVMPEERDPQTLMMLYNDLEFKGSKFGVDAFKILKKDFPELKIILFGVPVKPSGLPDWLNYYQMPERALLRKLYNTASVFVSPSLAEGFPLPPAEAMMCGAALTCTDIGGHREYAISNETAVLFLHSDPIDAANAIRSLLNDTDKRIRTAYAGNKYIQQFTWERSVREFEKILLKETGIESTSN